MGDTKTQVWNEIVQGLGKAMVWVACILLAVITKLAMDSRTVVLKRKDIIIKTVLSVFVGVLASIICANMYRWWGYVIVPVATLLGEDIIKYLMVNWERLLAKAFPGWIPKKKTRHKK